MDFLTRFNPATFGPAEWSNVAWAALTLYWIITWFSAKRPARAESSRERWSASHLPNCRRALAS